MRLSKSVRDKIWKLYYEGVPTYLIAKELDICEADVVAVLRTD